ncbi:hypothetical protein BDV95DRAFT_557072 [Massariosphaeria phaeospora]|uniref:Uncharacterized protein n=1 Tax=Massariosphaeria phaeospora TaxID=100035 RepID=A0A7C8MK95_9PLEO|nr:hypothetical protein BDV95DRAFT_557072 [Massariosphaeria phaeospora]
MPSGLVAMVGSIWRFRLLMVEELVQILTTIVDFISVVLLALFGPVIYTMILLVGACYLIELGSEDEQPKLDV